MLYIFELFIFELIIYLSVILSSGYCNLYPAMLYFCILKSYQKAGYYIMRLLIFGGSLEFITVEMLLSPFAPLQVFIMALLIQARHLFYGISMLEKFKGTGWKKFFLIFGMCDETFSINYTAKIPEDVDKGWFLPFAIFNEKRPTPAFVQYLGKFLPPAVFGMLVVYCLRNVDIVSAPHGLPEFISVIVTGALHIWKRQMLLSIAGGTICYMLLIHMI